MKKLLLLLFLFPLHSFAAEVSVWHVAPEGYSAAAYCNQLMAAVDPGDSCLTHSTIYGNVPGFCQSTQNNSWTGQLCATSSYRKNFNAVLPFGSQCPDGLVLGENNHCGVDCSSKQGELAGIEDSAVSPPGYESFCNGDCAITVSEYFQRTDNNLWVISWIYTGQSCGGGDPLNDPELPPGVEAPDPIDPDTNTDTDDDGDPDFNDGDIDGDGIPNSEDSDSDGDGIPNEDDPTPLGGAGESPTGSASTSEDCRHTPSCAGDAIQCAQLVEIWRLRCKNPDNTETEEISENLDQSIINDVTVKGDTALDEYETSAKEAIETEDEIGFDESFIAKVKSKFTFPACSDYSGQFYGHTIAITCSDTAPIRTALGYILFIAVIIGIYHLGHKQPGETK